ncbi:MAG: hypothetical protein DRQ56_01190 [Gammaproteobacteria bacterium]|nr:MAG: hypothetical protein DRQ56_01190 [Gammaproteobacteria bacterium]
MSTEQSRNGRRSPSRSHSLRAKQKRLILILSAALAVSFLLNLVLGVKMGGYAREATLSVVMEQKVQRELSELQPKLDKMAAEIESLTLKRLPGLVKLTYDEVLSVGQQYVKNIVFTRTGDEDSKYYEYKVVMDNRNLLPVRPEVKILFFDHVGIQVGVSELGMGNGLPITEPLERGEIRSYSSSLELADDLEPQYFQVQIFSPDVNG